jgi:hypothetical protein
MTDETVERLRARVEDGMAAVHELRRLLAEEERPKLVLIQGGRS